MSAGDIASNFDTTGATISHHLKMLKQAELIFEKKDKNYIYYQIKVTVLEDIMLWIIPCVSIFGAFLMYSYNLGVILDITLIAGVFMGLLFMIIGNYLPKARHNYTIGIKLPWILANEDNWNNTYRIAGVVWIIVGIVMIIASIMGSIKSGWLILGVLLFAVIIPSVYSFALHTRTE